MKGVRRAMLEKSEKGREGRRAHQLLLKCLSSQGGWVGKSCLTRWVAVWGTIEPSVYSLQLVESGCNHGRRTRWRRSEELPVDRHGTLQDGGQQSHGRCSAAARQKRAPAAF